MSYLHIPAVPRLSIGDVGNLTFHYNTTNSTQLNITLLSGRHDLVTLSPSNFTLSPSQHNFTSGYHAETAGTAVYSFKTSPLLETGDYLRMSVVHFPALEILATIIGWVYFAAWSISFYPQVFLNFYRRSVIGLNFDFLAYNLIGFGCYGVFNAALFWSPAIQALYFSQHPGGVNPVQLNDVIFALHAFLITGVTISQCFCFKRGKQRISFVALAFISAFFITGVIAAIVVFANRTTWLVFLYVLSYIKLVITLIKYVPQAYMNFRRKSTVGWSIWNVMLDFTGGSFSILQMFILSYNNDDWRSIFGDPTKFGLGLFSILFDILFMIQHYILYRVPGKTCAFRKPSDAEAEEEIEDEAEERPLIGTQNVQVNKLKSLLTWK